ncbi:MAG: endonuclease [Rhodospirillales bacterium]|nr:endonuclease [Rhodospirillales bacterium]
MRNILCGLAFCIGGLLSGLASAVEIPAACASQAPWGAPTWENGEPALTPLCRTAYIALHDPRKLVPDFVSWQLTRDHSLGCFPRKNSFAPDPDLAPGHRAELADYKNHPGFDRGHFAPNSDFEWDADVERESFYLSNMSPQASHLNQWEWEQLEAVTRAWTLTHAALIVMDGPIWDGAPQTIGDDNVAVPVAYWKVIVDPDTNDTLAFVMKNEPTPKGDLTPYLVSINDIEKAVGFSLPLPAGVNRVQLGVIWPADLAGFAKMKTRKCHPVTAAN